jgi:tetratricopeptide (TPR) repeat protein
LVKETPGVLFVLFGRDRLRWAEVEPEWTEVLDQHRLGALSPEDADDFLLKVPVPEPDLRARMIQGARGLPFYLDLQVDLYESLKNQGRTPELTQFGGSEPEILNRFLDHLGDTAARALTVLAHCRRFDEALWLHLGREFMGGLPPFSFGELHGFSFVEELEGGWLSLHALMREALCARTAEQEPLLHERLHRSLFGWWDEFCQPPDSRSITPVHEMALEEAESHRTTFERDTLGDWAAERDTVFYAAARYALVQELWKAVLISEELVLGREDINLARTLTNLGNITGRKGEFDDALALQERALQIAERKLGPDHQDVAIILRNLGVAFERKGELQEAIICHERALAIQERSLGPNHPGVSLALANLGTILQKRGELDEALSLLKRALEVAENSLGPKHHDLARILTNLGVTFQARGDLHRALACFVRALEIDERSLGPEHPEVAVILANIGNILEQRGELTEHCPCSREPSRSMSACSDPPTMR